MGSRQKHSLPSTRSSSRTSLSLESLVDWLVHQHLAGDYAQYGCGLSDFGGQGISIYPIAGLGLWVWIFRKTKEYLEPVLSFYL